jgi:Flp pilus assembly protein TadG
MQRVHHISRFNERRRRGASLVEFALCVPLVLGLFFSAVEFGHVNMVRNASENAVYEGARRGVVPGASAAQVQAATNRLLQRVGVTNAVVTVEPSTITNETEQVTVTAEIPLDENTLIAQQFFAGEVLKRSCTLTRERTQVLPVSIILNPGLSTSVATPTDSTNARRSRGR